MGHIPGVMQGVPAPGPREPAKSTILDFDKTGIYQQIVQADSAREVEQLENRIELIEAIQRVQLLQTLPETALFFLEQELKLHKFAPKQQVMKITRNNAFKNLWVIVEGQVMVLGEEAPGRTRVVNLLKKGEFWADRQMNWAGLPI